MNRRAALALLAALPFALRAATDSNPAAPASAPDLAEHPHWPLGFRLPDAFVVRRPDKRPPRADILLWLPPSTSPRALLIIPENSDSKHFGEYGPLREVASRHGLAIAYLRGAVQPGVEDQPAPADPARLPRLLDELAALAGLPALRHAPWIVFGKSSRGRLPFRTAWLHPERVIATVSYHAETPPYPPADYAVSPPDGFTPLHVNINGATEWGGTWHRHVRPALLGYRAHTGWLPHQVVVPGVGHGDYADVHGSPGWGKPFPDRVTCVEVWDYLALFIDRALRLRLPDSGSPSMAETPPALRAVNEADGWLLSPAAIDALLAGGSTEAAIRPAHEVPPESRLDHFWLPDETLARAWLRLHAPRGWSEGRSEAETA